MTILITHEGDGAEIKWSSGLHERAFRVGCDDNARTKEAEAGGLP